MSLIKISRVLKEYGQHTVLKDVSFTVERGDRLALVGHNGSGKSTLLKLLAGKEAEDFGSIIRAQDLRLSYLPQDTSLFGDESVTEYLAEAGGRPPHQVETILAGFGLEVNVLNRSLKELSSGQKTKIALARVLLEEADLLLLDEPTNNLDLPALLWLEEFLLQSRAAYVVISHDRQFLDRVAEKIIEVDWQDHRLIINKGSYSDYREQEARRRAHLKSEYETQQAEVERIAERAAKLKALAEAGPRWTSTDNDKHVKFYRSQRVARTARTAKTLERRASRLDTLEAPIERGLLELPLVSHKRGGAFDLELIAATTGYPGGFKLGPCDLDIRYGHRVGIIGLNGSGKSTLLKLIKGEAPVLGGERKVGSAVKIGDLTQEHESLPREQSLVDFLLNKTSADRSQVYEILTRFSFNADRATSPIGTLSPGERARLILALFTMMEINTLILDEPTNHLDLEALEALEEALETFTGTLIVVSHDRYFLERSRLERLYQVTAGTLAPIVDYQAYLAAAAAQAKKLIRLL